VCGSVIESVHPWDSVTCDCGRLSLSGGPERPQVYWKAEPGSSWTDLGGDIDDDGENPEPTEPPPAPPPRRPGFEAGR
jgi:hypothetical protein